MPTDFNALIEFCSQNWEAAKGPFMGAVLVALFFFIFKYIKKAILFPFNMFSLIRDRQFLIPQYLAKYQEALRQSTLTLSHSWKLEGQNLKDLFIPVHVAEKGNSKRLPLTTYLQNQYAQKPDARFVLIGDAGSGKSVAMGEIARNIWTWKRERLLLPVLLRFSEVKGATTADGLEEIIVKKLKQHQFEAKKGGQKAQNYVQEHLYKGNILLLLDGFDELEKTNRINIARLLNIFFSTHPQIPFVISSRIAVWERKSNPFPNLQFQLITMADFTPYEIRLFVNQWTFQGKKSGEQLADIIEEKIYLKTIATNPLMLTIIAYLYAQPKYILPDKRAKFYQVCVDALLEQWDYAKQVDKANHFESIDKVNILNQLAYEHIVNGKTTDEEISQNTVLQTIEGMMKKQGRPIEKRQQMLDEIVENASLLVRLPPDAYKFPHRTFMEYFAANYFFVEKKHEELLDLYQEDAGKWQETLSLFCGLNDNQAIANTTLQQLQDNFTASQHQKQPNTFVFTALVESQLLQPATGKTILALAKNYLDKHIDTTIIEQLGYFASKPNLDYTGEASDILLGLVNKKLSNDEFQELVMALVHIDNAAIQQILLTHSQRIDLTAVLTKMGKSAGRHAHRLLERVPKERYTAILNGLKEAGNLDFLFDLVKKSRNEDLQQEAAWTLCLSSKPKSFFDWLDTQSLEGVDPKMLQIVEQKYADWTWNKPYPLTQNGIKAVFLISHLGSLYIDKANEWKEEKESILKSAHNWIEFLIRGVLAEKGIALYINSFMSVDALISKKGAKILWRKNSKTWLNNGVFLVLILALSILSNIICLFLLKDYWIFSLLAGISLLSFFLLTIKDNKFAKKYLRRVLNKLCLQNNQYI